MRRLLTVTTRDGWKLRVVHYSPPESLPPRGVLLLGHAMMANSASLDKPPGRGFASTLAQEGFHVYAADMRGHGHSRPTPSEGGRYTYDDMVWLDVPALVDFVHQQQPQLALAVVGHSLVGHACLALLGQELDTPIRALVGISANVWLPHLEPNRLRWLEKSAQLLLMDVVSRGVGYLPARALRLGTDDVARPYIQQFLLWARSDRWTTMDGRIDYESPLWRIGIPLLWVTGGSDRLMCHPECAQRFVSPLSTVEHWVIRPTAHNGLFPDHMRIVTSPRAYPVWKDIARWLGASLGQV